MRRRLAPLHDRAARRTGTGTAGPVPGRAFAWALGLILGAAALLGPGPLHAQDPDTLDVDSVLPVPRVEPALVDTASRQRPSPGGALIRSMVLPGWGQAEFDAYFRGSIYFAGWAGNWYMNFRNAFRLDNARTRFDIRREQIEDQLIASSPDPDSMRAQLDSFPDILAGAVREDPLGNELRKLVDAREQQREDWIAWSLFWLLASGIDAFVTAHLHDFPADVELRPGRGQGASLRVGIPAGPSLRSAGKPLSPAGPPGRARAPGDGGMPDSR